MSGYNLLTFPNGSHAFNNGSDNFMMVSKEEWPIFLLRVELSCWTTLNIANARPYYPEYVNQPGFAGGPAPVNVDNNMHLTTREINNILADINKDINERFPREHYCDMGVFECGPSDLFNDMVGVDYEDPAFNATVVELTKRLHITNATAERMIDGTFLAAIRQVATVLDTEIPTEKRKSPLPGLFAGLTAVAVIVVGLRLFARHTFSGRIRSFDYAIVLALITTIVWSVLAIMQAEHMSYRVCNSNLDQILSTEKFFVVIDILYPISLLIIKISLLLFFHSLTPWKPLRVATILAFVFTLGTTVFLIIVAVKSFSFAYYWPILTAIDDNYFYGQSNKEQAIAAGALGILNDVVLWFLPLPMIWMLNLSVRERALAIFSFGIGLIACVANGMRIKALIVFLDIDRVAGGGAAPDPSAGDQYPTAVELSKWSMIEMYIAIICSSLPALRVLLQRIQEYIPGFSQTSSSNGSGGGIRISLRPVTEIDAEAAAMKVDSNTNSAQPDSRLPSRSCEDSLVNDEKAKGSSEHPRAPSPAQLKSPTFVTSAI